MSQSLEMSPKKRSRPAEFDDDLPDFLAKKQRSTQRLKSAFESIFDKYGRDFTGLGDEIDMETGEVVVDNGHLAGMAQDLDNGDMDVLQSPQPKRRRGRKPRWSMWTPVVTRSRGLEDEEASDAPNVADEPTEEEGDNSEHDFQDELLHQIRNHGERQQSKSATPVAEPLEDPPDEQAVSEKAQLQKDKPSEGGCGWTEQDTERLIQLRQRGLYFTEMEAYFVGRKQGTIRDKWERLVDSRPELEVKPTGLLARALAEIAAGRLPIRRGQKRAPLKRFSQEEDELLVELRKKKLQFIQMVPQFTDREEGILRRRFSVLAKKRPELKNLTGHIKSAYGYKRASDQYPDAELASGDDADADIPSKALFISKRKDATRDSWTPEEDSVVLQLTAKGVRYADMAPFVKGRSDITIRQRYNLLTGKKHHGTSRKSDKTDTSTVLKDPDRRKSAPGHIQSIPEVLHEARAAPDMGHSDSEYRPDIQPPPAKSTAERRSEKRHRIPRLPHHMISPALISPAVFGEEEEVLMEENIELSTSEDSTKPRARSGKSQLDSTGAIPTPQNDHLLAPQPKKGRGRPRKHPLPPSKASTQECTGPGVYETGTDHGMIADTDDSSEQQNTWWREPPVRRVDSSSPATRSKFISIACPAIEQLGDYSAVDHKLMDGDDSSGDEMVDADEDVIPTPTETRPTEGGHDLVPRLPDAAEDLSYVSTKYDSLPLFCTDDEPSLIDLPKVLLPSPDIDSSTKTMARVIQDTDHETSLSAMPSSLEAGDKRRPRSQVDPSSDDDEQEETATSKQLAGAQLGGKKKTRKRRKTVFTRFKHRGAHLRRTTGNQALAQTASNRLHNPSQRHDDHERKEESAIPSTTAGVVDKVQNVQPTKESSDFFMDGTELGEESLNIPPGFDVDTASAARDGSAAAPMERLHIRSDGIPDSMSSNDDANALGAPNHAASPGGFSEYDLSAHSLSQHRQREAYRGNFNQSPHALGDMDSPIMIPSDDENVEPAAVKQVAAKTPASGENPTSTSKKKSAATDTTHKRLNLGADIRKKAAQSPASKITPRMTTGHNALVSKLHSKKSFGQMSLRLSNTPRSFTTHKFPKALESSTPLRGLLHSSGFDCDDSSEDELCTPGRPLRQSIASM